jgi:hypothetical protein
LPDHGFNPHGDMTQEITLDDPLNQDPVKDPLSSSSSLETPTNPINDNDHDDDFDNTNNNNSGTHGRSSSRIKEKQKQHKDKVYSRIRQTMLKNDNTN